MPGHRFEQSRGAHAGGDVARPGHLPRADRLEASPPSHAASIRALQGAVGNRAARRILAHPDAPGQVRRAPGDDPIEDFIAARGHAELFAGLEVGMEEPAVIGQLLENFSNRTDFNYNFNSTAAFSHKGDCSVLVREFITIARECFGIENIEAESGKLGYFIEGGGKIVHNSDVRGNIDDGAHWFFETHTWAVWNGEPVDVLFGQFGVVPHLAGVTDEYVRKDGSVQYQAGDLTFYLKADAASEFDRYTTDPALKLRLG